MNSQQIAYIFGQMYARLDHALIITDVSAFINPNPARDMPRFIRALAAQHKTNLILDLMDQITAKPFPRLDNEYDQAEFFRGYYTEKKRLTAQE